MESQLKSNIFTIDSGIGSGRADVTRASSTRLTATNTLFIYVSKSNFYIYYVSKDLR